MALGQPSGDPGGPNGGSGGSKVAPRGLWRPPGAPRGHQEAPGGPKRQSRSIWLRFSSAHAVIYSTLKSLGAQNIVFYICLGGPRTGKDAPLWPPGGPRRPKTTVSLDLAKVFKRPCCNLQYFEGPRSSKHCILHMFRGPQDGKECTPVMLKTRSWGPGGRLQRGVPNKGFTILWTVLQ